MTEIKKKPYRKPRRNPINDENKSVIDALRKEFSDAKLWVGFDDSLEVNRRVIDGMKVTPGVGVTVDDHIAVLSAAIRNKIESFSEADQIIDTLLAKPKSKPKKILKTDEIPTTSDRVSDRLDFVELLFPNMTDHKTWDRISMFEMPYNFSYILGKQYMCGSSETSNCICEYKKFMYLKSVYPDSIPPENIDRVWRLHLTYTESYDAMCGLLGGRIHRNPDDNVTTNQNRSRYTVEFDTEPCGTAWADIEWTQMLTVDPTKYFIVKRIWPFV